MIDLITKHGGSAKFARKTGLNRRTVEDWKAGRRQPMEGLKALIVDALKWREKH